MRKEAVFDTRDMLNMMRTVLLVAWPVSAFAATQSLGNALTSISSSDWASLVTLSFISGLVALLYRVRKSLEAAAAHNKNDDADLQLIPWWIFAAAHMAGAMFVGALLFFLCEWLGVNPFLEAAVIALASWSGAKLADKLADGLSGNLVSRVSGAFGGTPP